MIEAKPTSAEIRNMPAGAELDAVVAQLIDGFDWFSREENGTRYGWLKKVTPQEIVRVKHGLQMQGSEHVAELYSDWSNYIPKYSTNPADADALMEWIEAQGWEWDAQSRGVRLSPHPFDFSDMEPIITQGDNWKHATTKAAVLLALRLEVSE